MLLCQDFRGSHQGALPAVPGRAVSRCRRNHGFAAAHIALHQPVHRRTLLKISQNLLHRPLLGTGEGKGQASIEFRQICVGIGRGFLFCPGSPHQRQSRGENEELFKNQTFLGHLRFPKIGRLVNGAVGPLCVQNAVLPPDFTG